MDEEFNRKIEAAQDQLHVLLDQVDQLTSDDREVTVEAVEALSQILGELRVNGIELSQKNEEMATACEALEAEHHRYQELFTLAPDGYLVTDAEGLIQEANQAASELLGREPDRLKGKSLALFVPEERQTEFYARMDRVRAGEDSPQDPWETRLQPQDGDLFHAAIRVAVLDGRDEPINLHWLVQDITRRKRAEQEQRESEEQFDLFMQHLPASVSIKDPEGRVVYANKQFAEFTNCEPEELIGRTTEDLLPEDLHALYSRENQRVLSGENIVSETTVQGSEGARHCITYKFPIYRSGEPAFIGSAGLDITERKQIEEKLRESERLYRDVAANIPGAIYQFLMYPGGAFDITYMSESGQAIFERPLEELTNPALLFKNVHPDDLASLQQSIYDAAQRMDSWVHEFRIVKPDGRVTWLRGSSSPRRLSDGSILWNGVVLDITERKRAEKALREGQALFQSLVDSMPQGVFSKDLDGRFTFANRYYCAIQNRPLEEIIGKNDFDLHPPELARKYRKDDRRVIETEEPFEAMEVHQPLGGEKAYVQVVKTPIYDAEGQISGLLGIFWDVTVLKLAEERVRHYAAELERSNRELEQFGYVISHDLQAPLRVVKSYLKLLADRYEGQPDAKADRYIDKAVDSAEHMQKMIRALLDLSRVGTRGEEFTPTDCESVLNHVLDGLSLVIEESGAEVAYDSLPTVMADEAQLAQVFQNLIANGIKFRREGIKPRVHISAKREGQEWLFSVADNGIGIDSEQAECVFQVFQRLHTEEEYPGLGIGLALCQRIMERHGGRIWVESEPGEGSTFSFTIPARKEKS